MLVHTRHVVEVRVAGRGLMRPRVELVARYRWPAAWEPLHDGQRVDAGNTSLVTIHTPGHAPGHVCLHEPASGILVVGDMVASAGTILIEPTDGDMRVYLEQLARLSRLGAALGLPAHGDPIEKPSETFDRYVAHRRMREAKVLSALKGRGTSGAPPARPTTPPAPDAGAADAGPRDHVDAGPPRRPAVRQGGHPGGSYPHRRLRRGVSGGEQRHAAGATAEPAGGDRGVGWRPPGGAPSRGVSLALSKPPGDRPRPAPRRRRRVRRAATRGEDWWEAGSAPAAKP